MDKNNIFASFLLLFFFFILLNTGIAQSIKPSNIHYRIIGDIIEIFFDLPTNHDSISLSVVFRKKSNSEFKYWPKFIDGDVGLGVFSGKNKKITWYFKKEPEHLFTGSDFYFKVYAKKIPKVAKKPTTDTIQLIDSIKH